MFIPFFYPGAQSMTGHVTCFRQISAHDEDQLVVRYPTVNMIGQHESGFDDSADLVGPNTGSDFFI